MTRYFGAVEAGGTKFVCAIGTDEGRLLQKTRFPTTSPEETLGRTVEFFEAATVPLTSVGVGAFGPLDLDPASAGFGSIAATPKPGWAGTRVRHSLTERLGLPVAIDTDVNAAAMGEFRWGAGQGLRTLLYITIGTGIGGGGLIDGKPMHGLVHPEMGHIRIPNNGPDGFRGHCPFHGDCFEGLASGPALAARWGRPAEALPPDHPAWEIEAEVIAMALHAYILTLSPQRIILGGGVMKQLHLFPLVRKKLVNSLNGYVQSRALLEEIDTYVVPPHLGDEAGIKGALALAETA